MSTPHRRARITTEAKRHHGTGRRAEGFSPLWLSACLFAACTVYLCLGGPSYLRGQTSSLASVGEIVTIDAQSPSHPFPHYWERMFGSGRAILALRESYRNDLRAVKQATDFGYIRFHGILDDESRFIRRQAGWETHLQFFLCRPDL